MINSGGQTRVVARERGARVKPGCIVEIESVSLSVYWLWGFRERQKSISTPRSLAWEMEYMRLISSKLGR